MEPAAAALSSGGVGTGERSGSSRRRCHQLTGRRPESFKADPVDRVDRRNDAAHKGIDLKYPEWEVAFRAALALVVQGFPLSTEPCTSEPLTCNRF